MKIGEHNSKTTSYPFRLGTTSYIYPDHILPNVRKLESEVDDIELVLFQVDDTCNLPDRLALEELGEIAIRQSLTYTVHLPIDVYLGDVDEAERVRSVEKVLRVLRLTLGLSPISFNLHFEYRRPDGRAIDELGPWKEQLRKSCSEIVPELPQPENLAIEYLNYPLELIDDIVQEFGLSFILDLGHMLAQQADFVDYLNRYLDRTLVIHLHGVAAGRDHLSLAKADLAQLETICRILRKRDYRNVLTLEIFSERDLTESLHVLERVWWNQK